MSTEYKTDRSGRASAFTDLNIPQNYHKYLEPYIFQPWAERLLDFADLKSGQTVLDVASGTGAVARAAARRLGPYGRVVASDISPVMVATIITHGSDGAPIDTLECQATSLTVQDHSFDMVLCQQGLPFIPERARAIREMRRAVRDGGVVCVAVFSCDFRCEPFETYLEILRDRGVPPPYPNAYDKNTYVMSEEDITNVFAEAGFSRIDVRTEQIGITWPNAEIAASGLFGTPFGAVVSKLDPFLNQQVIDEITNCFDGIKPVTRLSGSVLARAFT